MFKGKELPRLAFPLKKIYEDPYLQNRPEMLQKGVFVGSNMQDILGSNPAILTQLQDILVGKGEVSAYKHITIHPWDLMEVAQTNSSKKGEEKRYCYVLAYAIHFYVNLYIFYAFLRDECEF